MCGLNKCNGQLTVHPQPVGLPRGIRTSMVTLDSARRTWRRHVGSVRSRIISRFTMKSMDWQGWQQVMSEIDIGSQRHAEEWWPWSFLMAQPRHLTPRTMHYAVFQNHSAIAHTSTIVIYACTWFSATWGVLLLCSSLARVSRPSSNSSRVQNLLRSTVTPSKGSRSSLQEGALQEAERKLLEQRNSCLLHQN